MSAAAADTTLRHRQAPGSSATTPAPTIPAARRRKPEPSPHWVVQAQIPFTLLLVSSVMMAHEVARTVAPGLHRYIAPLISIQYVDPATGLAGIGLNDAWFVVSGTVVLTLVRALTSVGLESLAARVGLTRRRAVAKFIEQGWSLIYYLLTFLAGLYLFYDSEYWLSAESLWRGWPHHQLDVRLKAYYLILLAGWFQQLFVLHIEARRKDHYQMLIHHIVTILLMLGSYYQHYTRVGHVFLLIMDSVDSQLSLAKVFNYLGWHLACDAMFLIFMVNWIIFRHGFFNYLLHSAYTAPALIDQRCHYDAAGDLIRCYSPLAHRFLVVMLAVLQVITIIWFALIVKIAWRVVRGTSANDDRSDISSEEDVAQETQKQK